MAETHTQPDEPSYTIVIDRNALVSLQRPIETVCPSKGCGSRQAKVPHLLGFKKGKDDPDNKKMLPPVIICTVCGAWRYIGHRKITVSITDSGGLP